MSEFIDIANILSHQEFERPPVQGPLPMAKEPHTEGLKKHFLDVFSRHPHANAFVFQSSKGHYRLRLDRSGLVYTEKSEGHTEEIKYDFKENHVFRNHEQQSPVFLKKFMSRLREISEDIEDNLATIYEEVL